MSSKILYTVRSSRLKDGLWKILFYFFYEFIYNNGLDLYKVVQYFIRVNLLVPIMFNFWSNDFSITTKVLI